MAFFPVFLSIVYVVRNQSDTIEELLQLATKCISPMVSDYELIIVDNASTDDSYNKLKNITSENGLPNVQVYALTKEVDSGTASWLGLENALGDFIAVLDPLADDINFLSTMLDKATTGTDVVFANNEQEAKQSTIYRYSYALFSNLYKRFSGIHLAKDAPQYRLLSKRIVNFILQHPQPAITYRHLPASGGFSRANLSYSSPTKSAHAKPLGESIDRAMCLLVSTTRAPMRLVTSLSLFGAAANLVYSLYVVAVALFASDVAPGWTSLSLQQSGMFFLLSLVLLVLGEYILHMVSLSNEGPAYHIRQEFTSARMTRREKLNIEEGPTKESQHTNIEPVKL
jgi:hypothetical protein